MLKKIPLVLTAFICLFSIWGLINKPLFTGYAGTFEIYLSNGSNINPVCQVGFLESTFINNKKGEACKIKGEKFSLEDFLAKFNAYIVDVEYTESSVNYYAFSPNVKYLATIKGKRVNLHVSIGKNQIKIGSPIIYGSF